MTVERTAQLLFTNEQRRTLLGLIEQSRYISDTDLSMEIDPLNSDDSSEDDMLLIDEDEDQDEDDPYQKGLSTKNVVQQHSNSSEQTKYIANLEGKQRILQIEEMIKSPLSILASVSLNELFKEQIEKLFLIQEFSLCITKIRILHENGHVDVRTLCIEALCKAYLQDYIGSRETMLKLNELISFDSKYSKILEEILKEPTLESQSETESLVRRIVVTETTQQDTPIPEAKTKVIKIPTTTLEPKTKVFHYTRQTIMSLSSIEIRKILETAYKGDYSEAIKRLDSIRVNDTYFLNSRYMKIELLLYRSRSIQRKIGENLYDLQLVLLECDNLLELAKKLSVIGKIITPSVKKSIGRIFAYRAIARAEIHKKSETLDKNNLNSCITDFNSSLESGFSEYVLYDSMIDLFIHLGEFKNAYKMLKISLSLYPLRQENHINLARTHIGLGNIGEAISSLKKVDKDFPDYPIALYNIVLLYKQLGQPIESLKYLNILDDKHSTPEIEKIRRDLSFEVLLIASKSLQQSC